MFRLKNSIEQVPAVAWTTWRDDNNAVVIDVREPDEWANGVLPEVEKMALSTIATEWQKLDPNQAVLVVCRSGSRSQQVANALAKAGFVNVANMRGGMAALGLA